MYAFSGNAEAAERWARAAIRGDPAATMSDGSPASAWIAQLRALLCVDGGSAMREDALLAVETLAEESPFLMSAKNLLGFAYLLGGEDDQATTWFHESASRSPGLGAGVCRSLALAALALLAGSRDDVEEGEALARGSVEAVEQSHLEEYVTSAFVYAVAGRSAFAGERRQRSREDAAAADRLVPGLTHALPWLAVITRMELARLHLVLANPARARSLMDEAEEILARRPNLGVAGERVAQLRNGVAARPTGEGVPSVLTPAELRLLPLLASYLSFREIAARLGVSRNTVKTQAIAIYRKLKVSSRSEAVAHARETGLLKDNAPLP
jgi:LuxR family maltose regulon positive regulatory protein